MASPEIDSAPPKKVPPQESRWTLMVIRSVGRVRSFKVSPRLLFWAGLFFILYIPVSVLIINNYISLYRKHAMQSERIKQLETAAKESQKRLNRFRQHVALLEDYIRHLEEPEAGRRASGGTPQKEKGPEAPSVAANGEIQTGPKEKIHAGVVDIKDMIIQREGTQMSVDFKLVNMNPGETAVGGYIHLIAVGNRPDPPLEWTFPRVRLQEGFPVNFRRGQLFLIQWFKPVHGKFHWAPDTEPPTGLRVLVYDQSGELILEKEFEVSHVS